VRQVWSGTTTRITFRRMGTCPDSIKRLIDRFDQQSDQVRSPDYNETQLRIDFVNPMFAVLGWDIDNNQGFAEQYREVVHEDRVKVAGATKAPDYSFRVGGQRKYFLEAKKPAVNIKQNWEPAYQLRRYGWSAKLAVSLLTDFEELAIYDCRVQPKLMEKASVARRDFIAYRDYPDRWGFIVGTFSKDAVLRGEFDRYCATKKGRGAQEFDEAFLEEIEEWRKALASNLALRNASLTESELNFAVQRIIDRIIFLRMAEDRGTETTGQLQALLNGEKIYDRLCKLFRDADARYNSGLFHFATEKGRDEAPDTLTPRLEIDDKPLKNIFKRLYYPESPYEFTVVTADILGSVYERFLGKVITLTDGHRAKIEEKPEVRKAGGVYYTPTYIVDYIVKNTVGKLLGTADNADAADSKSNGLSAVSALSAVNPSLSPKDASKLKFLDPACGSGSFLIGAYQFLLDWYLQQYIAANPAQLATGKHPVLRPAMTNLVATAVPAVSPNAAGTAAAIGGWKLTIAERKRILLDHIHGVDLDGQAVEVTKLNLLLKCLEGETSQTLGFEQRLFRERALPDLGKNILCGNSLIGTDIIGTEAWNAMSEEERRRINPFDYERAFPAVFKGKDGGFDAVIGNPPYIRSQLMTALDREYFGKKYKSATATYDIYVLFLERSLKWLNREGRAGFILPNKFFTADYGDGIRGLLTASNAIESIVDFQDAQLFSSAGTYTCVIVLKHNVGKPKYASLGAVWSAGAVKALAGVLASGEIGLDYLANDLAQERWTLSAGRVGAMFARLHRLFPPFVGTRPHLFQGLKTSADKLYMLTVDGDSGQTLSVTNQLGESFEVEPEIVRPVVKGEDVQRYAISRHQKLTILYPYTIENERARLLEQTEMMGQFPKAWKYLERHKETLGARDKGLWASRDDWYAYARAQNIGAFVGPKLLVPYMTTHLRAAFDPDESLFFVNITTGGYGLRAELVNHDCRYLLALVNSRLWNVGIKQMTSAFRGGYFAVNKQALERMPWRAIRFDTAAESRTHSDMVSLVTTMLSLHNRLSAEKLPQRREQIQREIDATDRQIDALVYQLYGLTDDEIRIVEDATR